MRTALRLLPLPFSIALCLPALANDEKPDSWALCPIQDVIPVFGGAPQPSANGNAQAARDQRADQPTSIEGDQLGGTETNLEYQGNVALSRGDQFLGADNLKYDQEQDTYVADGHIRYQDTGIRLLADTARGNQATDTHQIDNVRYQLVSRRGNGGADRIDMKGPEGSLLHSTYSTCDPEDRRWELRSRRIDIDTDGGWGVAHGATIRLGKVPVLYVPYLKFPVDDQRHTGLLYPAIGMSGRNGFDWKQPIYLNLAPNYDATLEPRYMSKRGFQMGAEFRYLYEKGRGEIQGTWMTRDNLVRDRMKEPDYDPNNPNNPDPDAGRGFLSYEGSHRFSRNWQARANLIWLSDARYQEQFGSSLYGQAYSSVTSTAGVYGAGEYWSAGVMADHWQLSDYTSRKEALPYNRVPRTYLNWNQPLSRWINVGGHAEAVRFQHDSRAGGSRIDIKPTVSFPIQGASWYITPTLAYRYTGYRLDAELAQKTATDRAIAAYGLPANQITPAMIAEFYDPSPSRGLPIGSLDAGVYFDRETEIKGDRFLQTLEPRLFYLNAPYREQDGLPIFDTRPFNFSYGQLFRDNRYTGADRQADANQLTLALTTRLLRQKDGFERLSASVGQIRYFDDSLVTYSSAEVPLERGKSAWVVDANYAPTDRWTIGASYQWDPKFRREDLASVRARYLLPDDGVVNITYRRRRELLEQADFSFLYPVTPTWSVVGRYYRSFYRDESRGIEPGLLEGVAGVQWDSCCLAVRGLVRRYVRNREGEMNTAFQVEFVLKGLGSAGRDTDRILRRAILGYYRDDLYLVPPSNIAPRPDDTSYAPDPMP
ncbi:LPS-assembly protein [Pseudoxanthomonas japonensis]|uniref:LPS assembly protein LptD n=1 Tax=Pseudoxanthomonas TaxID=83618 RepID=UPI0007860A43|nr:MULTISPECIES: LPS assembly protein LptD [Pseudoxanthomonas]MBA3929484.1 LPS-assembly protein LptD [Xanthomonas sp.]MBL8256147.1 LPS assembly protein LptD [Pseudoxanthomonas mexicana]MDR7069458.1 LPS-assembly protein [Pseudoxanthomonas japonensis]